MAFQVRCNFNRIQSYAQAVKAWEKGVIFPSRKRNLLRAEPLAPRGLVDIRKKHLTVEQTEAGNVVLRLYDYPVVTWHRDNSVTIRAYNSRSTAVFGSHCTPEGMFVSSGRYFRVTIHERTYKVDKEITFRERDGTWKADQITPWSVRVVNRERAKQALQDTGYKEFRLWLQVYMQMAARPDGRPGWMDDNSIVLMLRDRNRWRDLVACRFLHAWYSPDRILREVRQAIYAEHDCFDRKPVAFL